MDDLFTMAAGNMMAPLAERMRPRSLADFIGQKHLVSPDSLLSRAIRTRSALHHGKMNVKKVD